MTLDLASPNRDETIGTAWDLVDWLERLRKMLGVVAGVKREAWFKLLERQLAPVEDLRNFTQHFDGSVTKLVNEECPLMGTVIASFPADAGVYSRAIISWPARYLNEEIRLWWLGQAESVASPVDRITFCVADLVVNLTEMKVSVEKAKLHLKQYLSDKYQFPWPDQFLKFE